MMTAGMIPLAFQLTDTERAAKQRPDDLPWHRWEPLSVLTSDLALLRMDVLEGQLVATLPDELPRRVSPSFFEGLGGETTFPPQFIAKLSAELQARVINERIDATPPRQISLVLNKETCVRFLPGDRAVVAPVAVADRVYDRMLDLYGGVQIDQATAHDGEHWLRFTTPYTRRLTGEVVEIDRDRHEYLAEGDDVLSMGVQVRHEFRDGLSIELHVKRLRCYNSAFSSHRAYSWRVKEDRSEAAQLYWLDDVLAELPDAFEQFVTRAHQMSVEKFEGHPRTALQATAKAMRLPKRLLPGLFAAFDQEPGDTHYHLWNAVTRLGSHADLSPGIRREICRTAGQWAEEFDLVTCRMPRPMANAAGAQIIEE